MFISIKFKHEQIKTYTLFVKLLYAITIQKQKFHHLISLNIMVVARILIREKHFWRSASWGVWGQRSPLDAGEFSINFLRKLLKMHYFSIYFKTNHALIFPFLDERQKFLGNFEKIFEFLIKIQQKIEILYNFWKFYYKNRAFRNNIIFLQQFFGFRGISPHPSFLRWLRPCLP